MPLPHDRPHLPTLPWVLGDDKAQEETTQVSEAGIPRRHAAHAGMGRRAAAVLAKL